MSGVFKELDWVRVVHPLEESWASKEYAGELGRVEVQAAVPGGECTVRMDKDGTPQQLPEEALKKVPTDEYGEPLL